MAAVTPAEPPDAARLAAVIAAVRGGGLRVHCLTSAVAAERTANTLLALNVRPSLTIHPAEVADFVARSDALLVNLGMTDTEREAAIGPAIGAAQRHGRPWALDPVFVDVSARRRDLAMRCLMRAPAVLKANAAEAFLADAAPEATACVTTGATDAIRHGGRRLRIGNGHPLAARVTAAGCALGAVIAACLAVEADPLVAAAAALAAYGVAAERAGAACPGRPASFGVALIDALAGLDGPTLIRQTRLIRHD